MAIHAAKGKQPARSLGEGLGAGPARSSQPRGSRGLVPDPPQWPPVSPGYQSWTFWPTTLSIGIPATAKSHVQEPFLFQERGGVWDVPLIAPCRGTGISYNLSPKSHQQIAPGLCHTNLPAQTGVTDDGERSNEDVSRPENLSEPSSCFAGSPSRPQQGAAALPCQEGRAQTFYCHVSEKGIVSVPPAFYF